MIFVTVGSQLPFDRMIRAIDEWAASRGRQDVFAQIGFTDYRPCSIEYCAELSPTAFLDRVMASGLIVAHAGMGSVLTALEVGKPMLVMPRRGDMKETRNDHQAATCRWLKTISGIYVAQDEQELKNKLDTVLDATTAKTLISRVAPDQLIVRLSDFISAN